MVFSLILPKCAKTREPKDDTLPLDNPKIYLHLALPYIRVEMQLQVGQANGMDLHPIGIVMVNLGINDKQLEHTFIVC